MARTFEDVEAKRSRVPLLIGLVGPSGGGKTYSALRLATGIQRVTGGEIFLIDTEARRALHYADRFRFRHVPFGAPFSPLDYLAAIEHSAKKGAGIVIVDSMSHEHEGPGGVLEMHDVETARLAKLWKCSEAKAQMSAWGEPKKARRRMINTILQLPISLISCFRAKEKLKIKTGEDPKPLGFMAIAGEEFVYEQTINCLLLPGAKGVPTWHSREIGEAQQIKLPEQFRAIMGQREPLSEDIGESLAKWAEGGPVSPFEKLVTAVRGLTLDTLESIVPQIEAEKKKKTLNTAEYQALRAAYATRRAELEPPKAEPDHDPETGEVSAANEPPARQPGED